MKLRVMFQDRCKPDIRRMKQWMDEGVAMPCAMHSSTGRPANLDFLKASSLSFGNAPPDKQRRRHTLSGLTGLVAAGLDGIARKIDPGQLNLDNLYELPEEQVSARKIEVLPETLDEAIKAMTKDSVVKGALGKDYADLYLTVKREEWLAHNRTVSSTEREHYLAIY